MQRDSSRRFYQFYDASRLKNRRTTQYCHGRRLSVGCRLSAVFVKTAKVNENFSFNPFSTLNKFFLRQVATRLLRRFYQFHDASRPQNRLTLSTVMAVGLCVFVKTAKVNEYFSS